MVIVASANLTAADIRQGMVGSGKGAIVAMSKGIVEAVGLGGHASSGPGDIKVGVKVKRVRRFHFIAHTAFIGTVPVDILQRLHPILLIDRCGAATG